MDEHSLQRIIVTFAWGLIAAGSSVACARYRRPAAYLQLAGSATFVAASLMNYLRLYRVDLSGGIQPAWLWELQGWMLVGGATAFAVGYLWYWAEHRRRVARAAS